MKTLRNFYSKNLMWMVTKFIFVASLLQVTLSFAQQPADWMSGKFGVSWRMPAGDGPEVHSYDADSTITQLATIPDLTYVIINITRGADGLRYVAPHSILDTLCPGSTPTGRDLFLEMAVPLKQAGYKVMVYMATEGPAKLKHGPTKAFDYNSTTGISPNVEAWKNYVLNDLYPGGSETDDEKFKNAYANIIVNEYAERYGTLIDGWWFDHATYGNIPLLDSVVKSHNPDAIVAYNKGQKIPLINNNPPYENYTFGHPTPVKTAVASDDRNLPMVTSVESTPDGYLENSNSYSLGHLYMPVQEVWNAGSVIWPLAKAIDWKSRVLAAKGAWTWNVGTNKKVTGTWSTLDDAAIAFIKDVVAGIFIKVTSIDVIGQGNISTVDSGSTLQMEASILPTNALDQSVTWSVTNETGSATIDSNGLLSGLTAGTVLVIATANDGSGVSGQKQITVNSTSGVSPIAQYRFENTANDSAGTNHGTLNGGVSFSSSIFKEGSYSLSLDGQNDFVDLTAHVNNFPQGGTARTITGWFNGTSGSIFTYGKTSTGERVTIKATPSEVSVSLSGHKWGNDNLSLSSGWHHVAVVLPNITNVQSDEFLLYIDGSLINSSSLAGSPKTVNTGNTYAKIGANYLGEIDDIRIYDIDLSEAEIQTVMNEAGGTSAKSASVKSDNSNTMDLKTSLSSSNIKLYPNPSNGLVTLTYPSPAGRKLLIRLSDQFGKLVLNKYISLDENQNNFQLDLGSTRNLSDGLYILQIEGIEGQSKVIKKIVIKN
ncbi:MAG: Ig-like domain-containing protein [Algibacter sp.]|uniref:T9SS type A sorting domain-containing protein n=1 Tax=Algibacter sp. TaxID=1872428 RepID=UPI003298BACB